MKQDTLKFGLTTAKRWLENRNDGKNFVQYIKAHSWDTVGIYGGGEFGKILYGEIKGSVNVRYFIDRNAETIHDVDDIPVILPQDIKDNETCDIVIITVMSDFDSICEMIRKQKPEQAVIALRDAVYEL